MILKIVVIGIFTLNTIVFATTAQKFTQEPILLDVHQALPQKLLQGKNYKVNEKVTNDGIFNIYTLTTDYGLLKVESTQTLPIRINELTALKALEELHLGKLAAESAGTTEGMRKLVRDKSPGELEKINLKKMEQMGIDTSLAEALLSITQKINYFIY